MPYAFVSVITLCLICCCWPVVALQLEKEDVTLSEFVICPVLNVVSSVSYLPVLGSDLFLCLIYNVLCKFQSTFIDDSKSIEDARERGHIHLSEVIPYSVHSVTKIPLCIYP